MERKAAYRKRVSYGKQEDIQLYDSLEKIVEEMEISHIDFWQVILEDDIRERGITEAESFGQMEQMYEAMCQADKAYDGTLSSASGLVGGEGSKLQKAREEGHLLCGSFLGLVMEKALKMGESNACMRRIVAAPTAGSCGVVPAVLLSLEQEKQFSKEQMVKALYVAAGIGGVIASRAFIAGAAGGCQAEIGAASAMAAGAAVWLMGGTGEDISHAVALSLKNLLGLVCDPVAGLVEVPCVKRNALGAVNALMCADEAMAGIYSKIPADEVIDAMRAVGRSMPEHLRETGTGGVAATPSGMAIKEKMGRSVQ